MVLGPQGPGRVGRCQARARTHLTDGFFFYAGCAVKLRKIDVSKLPGQFAGPLRLAPVFAILYGKAKAVQDKSTVKSTPRERFPVAGRKHV